MEPNTSQTSIFAELIIWFGFVRVMIGRLFQHMDDNIFQDFLDILTIIYLDDILIFFGTREEHDLGVHFSRIMRIRSTKLNKCSFDCNKVEFLGDIESISID